MTNHFVLDDDTPTGSRLDQITAPTLVLHGTTDPMFPLEHGRALAAEIPGARLIPSPAPGINNRHETSGTWPSRQSSTTPKKLTPDNRRHDWQRSRFRAPKA